jgi:hypothetical protein
LINIVVVVGGVEKWKSKLLFSYSSKYGGAVEELLRYRVKRKELFSTGDAG